MNQQIYNHLTAMETARKQYPCNLLRAITGRPCEGVFLPGLEEALETLPPREKECLIMRFAHRMTLAAVGEHYGLSRERARQIEAKGLRKLAHPSRMRLFLTVPSEKYYDLAERHRVLQGEYDDLAQRHRALRDDREALSAAEDVAARDILIEDADFSVRSYNCLKRTGACTLGDVADMTGADLLRQRNLGRKSADEIISVLGQFGLKLKSMEGDAYA